jgi:HPt (histidine-containing phosphotransfer) domain-containing protein
MNLHVGKPFRRETLFVSLAAALSGNARFRVHDASETKNAAPGEQPAFDPGVIDAFRADSGEELLQLLIDTFLQDAAKKLNRLSELAGSADGVAEAIQLSHSLKSSGAMAGAMALAAFASEIEGRLQDGSGVLLQSETRGLRSAFEGYCDGLATLRAAR